MTGRPAGHDPHRGDFSTRPRPTRPTPSESFWEPLQPSRPRDSLEGENYFASAVYVTDGERRSPHLDATVRRPQSLKGAPVTATASDGDGNTSEFSQQIVLAIAPVSGPPAGGTPVLIAETNFDPAVAVMIGGVAPSNVVRLSDTLISAETAGSTSGGLLNDVVVMNPDTDDRDPAEGLGGRLSRRSELPHPSTSTSRCPRVQRA